MIRANIFRNLIPNSQFVFLNGSVNLYFPLYFLIDGRIGCFKYTKIDKLPYISIMTSIFIIMQQYSQKPKIFGKLQFFLLKN